MPSQNLCCVPGCKFIPGTVRHRFPIFEEGQFNEWVKRISNPKFVALSKEVIHKRYLVCDKHFNDSCRSVGTKRLNRLSLPTLNLPGFCEEHVSENHDEGSAVPDFGNKEFSQSISTPPHNGNTVSGFEERSVGEHDDGTITNLSIEKVLLCTPKQVTTVSEERRKKNLLQQLNVHRANDLTPKARHLYGKAKYYKTRTAVLSKKFLSFKKRLSAAEHYSNCLSSGERLNVNPLTSAFIKSQVRNQKRHPKGYRFTTEDKILSLSLFKQSGKTYRYLSKIFALPSRKCLLNLLRKVPLKPGLNERILQHLGKTVSKLQPLDKYCTLLLDEMQISAGLQYNRGDDVIEGFQDLGDGNRQPAFADHAVVFMARGIRKKWKQPLSYMLVESTTKTVDLVRCIKQIIRGLFKTGLKVVATVCDQGATNVAAINYLLKDTQAHFLRQGKENDSCRFLVDDELIVPLYDPPHLLKGIRNNLLSKNVTFMQDGKLKTASWNHVVNFYKLDVAGGNDDKRMCPRLTDEHVIPGKIKKMKVKCCSQVFSQRVSAIMRRLAIWSRRLLPPGGGAASTDQTGGEVDVFLDPEAENTADFLLFMDQLFDSVNGSSIVPVHGKMLRCAVTPTSAHNKFWLEALKMISTMKFLCNGTKQHSVPPSIRHWGSTVSGMKLLCKELLNEGFKFVNTRNFNQDPLENLFGSIRSHGVRNINPTCTGFISSLKSLVITNFISVHSAGSNCEEDKTDGALDTLTSFIVSDTHQTLQEQPEAEPDYPDVSFQSETVKQGNFTLKRHFAQAKDTYVCGYVAKTVFAFTKKCPTCKSVLIAQEESLQHDFVIARRYSPKALCLPNTQFVSMCSEITDAIRSVLPLNSHKIGVAKMLYKVIYKTIDFSYLTCKKHDVKSVVTKLVIRMMIFTWVKNVNNILKGKVALPNACDDPIKIKAKKYYQKHRTVN